MNTKHFKEKFDKEYALIDGILLSFDLNLRYDYMIPSGSDIKNLIDMYLFKTDTKDPLPPKFRSQLIEMSKNSKDEYSMIEKYLQFDINRFGKEWFYGFGMLYRWRKGEKEQAEKRIEKYLTSYQKKHLKVLQKAIKIKKSPKMFEPMISNIGKIF